MMLTHDSSTYQWMQSFASPLRMSCTPYPTFLSSHDPDPASRFFFSAAAFAFLASPGPTGGRFR